MTKNVPPNSVCAGNPAQYICSISEYLEKCKDKDISKVPYFMPSDEKKIVLTKIFEKRFN
ncbi:hypothetical protein Mpsy_0542 [Methanolobus psychrophilus R15]|nr:hypothetical protein Mpsy_0542 [Methanolobus psychrophilus R15]